MHGVADDKVYLSAISVRDLRGVRSFDAKLGIISIVVGENGAGKTTLLEAVSDVLDGGHDPESIRQGAEQAEIRLSLSNGTTAVKTITPAGYELQVKNGDGGVVKAPATYLKSLAPGLSFDPLAFLASDPKERAAFLLKTLPLSFEAGEVNEALGTPTVTGTVTLQRLNELRQGKYDERKELNRQIRDTEGMIADMKKSLPPDQERVSDWGAVRDQLAEKVAAIDGDIERIGVEIELEAEQSRSSKREEISRRMAELQAELEEHIQTVNRVSAEALAEQTAEMRSRQASLSLQLGEARANADRQQQAAGMLKAIEQRAEALKGSTLKEIRLTNALERIDALKHKKLKELPIAGFDLKADSRGRPVILIDGIALDKLNRQQQLYIAIQAVSLASGKMPMCIAEVAELDNDHLVELAEAAESAGIQLVMARWMDKEPLTVMSLDQYRERMQVTA